MPGVVRPVIAPVTQRWGNGATGANGAGGHPGTDYGAQRGTVIHSCADGWVLYAGPASGFGDHAVAIWHPALGVSSTYGHMQAHYVSAGQAVAAGAGIGECDNQGYSFGDHLHFEIRPVQAAFGGNPPNIDSDAWLHANGAYGGNPVSPGGQLTDADRAGIRRMQAALGVGVDGGWGPQTDRAMFTLALWGTEHPGVYNAVLQAVQAAWNFTPADRDGRWGPKTAAAYKLLRFCYLNK